MTALVAVVGVVLLLGLAVLIGASMDTERQRVAWREVAEERRLHNEELRRLREELRRLYEERRRLRADRAIWSRPRCADCPFNELDDPDED